MGLLLIKVLLSSTDAVGNSCTIVFKAYNGCGEAETAEKRSVVGAE
jgi:hypothetical protein